MRHPLLQDVIGRKMKIRIEHRYFPTSKTRLDQPSARYQEEEKIIESLRKCKNIVNNPTY